VGRRKRGIAAERVQRHSNSEGKLKTSSDSTGMSWGGIGDAGVTGAGNYGEGLKT